MSILSASWQDTNYSSTFSKIVQKTIREISLHRKCSSFLAPRRAICWVDTLWLSPNQTHTNWQPPPPPNPHAAHAHRHTLPLKKYSLIYIKSSIHCFYASNVALGKLICTNRTDHDSKIIILGKHGTYSLEWFNALFISLFALSTHHQSLLLWH